MEGGKCWTLDVKEFVLKHVEEDPSPSAHWVQAAKYVVCVSVCQVLHEQLLYLYHLQWVQILSPLEILPT